MWAPPPSDTTRPGRRGDKQFARLRGRTAAPAAHPRGARRQFPPARAMATSSISTPPQTATSGLVPARWTSLVLLGLRVIAGLMFASHGAQKLLGWFGGMGPGGSVPAFTLPWFAGALELVGGVLVALGLATRPVAFVLAGEMAVAYFMAHAPQGMHPLVNHGESAVLYCFIFLTLWAVGPGAYSLDARRGLVR